MSKIKYLEIDDDVNVFVVGDIHGCYTQFRDELKRLGFNPNTDLVISVGDLVDRGVENEKCVGLLNEFWFTAVKGNHEDFCYKGVMNDTVAYYHKMHNNGGQWFYELPDNVQEAVARRLNQLPLMLEVKYKGKKFGFVHADLPYEDWELVKERVKCGDVLDGRLIDEHLLWSRGIIEKFLNTGRQTNIAQIDRVFLGHTVLPEITEVGNCVFLDTGGVFSKYGEQYKLSIVKLSDFIKE